MPFLSYMHTRSYCIKQWLKLTSDDVKEQIYKLAKKGLSPSQIGKVTGGLWGVSDSVFMVCRCDTPGLPRCGASQTGHWKQNFAYSQKQR